ncbi:MAG: hypothetical protein QME52_04045 [Bacteroidota bacterium]|nr:hypothetical protein [Bacteroidota bacterium]
MEKKSRREFLSKFGATVGALTIGKDIMNTFPFPDLLQKESRVAPTSGEPQSRKVDFRYAPKNWQSTYCFPDDPFKSLVGKNGELLYGHQGIGKDEKVFPHIVSFGLKGKEALTYIEQKLESPSIPIITTKLEGGDVIVQLTTFATNNSDEGRVDNVLVEIIPKDSDKVQCSPEIIIKSESKFIKTNEDDDYSIIEIETDTRKIFMVVDAAGEFRSDGDINRLQLKSATTAKEKSIKFFVRFPQEGQGYDKIEDGLEEPEDMLTEARAFWKRWKPTGGKVGWKLTESYNDFLVSSIRNIVQAREIKDGKNVFQVGPTVYRGLWIVDGNFLLEAARYLGYDKEAQEGLKSIWDRQDDNGLFTAGAGEAHWKDTAVAVYALVRQAELSQNWDYFNEMYTDAHKAIMALKELRDKAIDDGSANGKYKLLPRGYGDSGIGGICEEYTNTLWALVGTNALYEVSRRFRLPRWQEIRDFYGELRPSFFNSVNQELRKHPNGFSYLPMLMKSDPKWLESDINKQPKPQAAQIYLSHAIYPGLLFTKDDKLVRGHIELMKSIVKEDIPIETGWLANDALWPYNAAIVAQVFLWLGEQDLARKTFIGFLNHASPLYTWREEQSLQDADVFNFIGDMPHNWASAECIRFLRHMMILEDAKDLHLFKGIGLPELENGKELSLSYSPTRWGKVSVTLEPIDKLTWRTRFKREDFDEKAYSQLDWIKLPRKLAGVYNFNGIKGVKIGREVDQVLVKPEFTEWECEWKAWSKG